MSTVVKEEDLCYDPEVVIANNNNNSINNNHEEGVEYLLSPYQACIMCLWDALFTLSGGC